MLLFKRLRRHLNFFSCLFVLLVMSGAVKGCESDIINEQKSEPIVAPSAGLAVVPAAR